MRSPRSTSAAPIAEIVAAVMRELERTRADHLWSQREAAHFLGVSTRYLRESSCPKVLLPGTGEKGQPIVRYGPAAVEQWYLNWSTHQRRERIA
jgi:hypothetical protein